MQLIFLAGSVQCYLVDGPMGTHCHYTGPKIAQPAAVPQNYI